jgi:hypothetical protein
MIVLQEIDQSDSDQAFADDPVPDSRHMLIAAAPAFNAASVSPSSRIPQGPDDLPADARSPYIRRHKTIAASADDASVRVVPSPVCILQPSRAALDPAAPNALEHDSVDISDIDLAVTPDDLGPVELREHKASGTSILIEPSVEVKRSSGTANVQVSLLNRMCAVVYAYVHCLFVHVTALAYSPAPVPRCSINSNVGDDHEPPYCA